MVKVRVTSESSYTKSSVRMILRTENDYMRYPDEDPELDMWDKISAIE